MSIKLSSLDSVELPDKVIKNIKTYFGEEGVRWSSNFKNHLLETCNEWDLKPNIPFSNLSINFVSPVTLKNGKIAVLKMGFPNKDFITECHSLKHFNGQGFVNLLKSDPEKGRMLLDLIEPGDSLKKVINDEEATRIAAKAMKQIWKPVVDDSFYPSLNDLFKAFRELRKRFNGRTGPFEERIITLAESISAEMLANIDQKVLLHGDFHHDNIILSNTRGWLAIDPKGVIGEREYEVGAYLLNPNPVIFIKNFNKRISIFSNEIGLDRKKMIRWTFCKAVLSAVWGVDGSKNDWKPCIDLANNISLEL